jgi:TRAP-type C4-dicarboxylate transport system substrate-binding protein
MVSGFCRNLFVSLLFGALLIAPARADETKYHLRCSLDTSATHGRTIYIGEYLKDLAAASGGRIETELFHSGQLYRDRDIAKALRQGAVEMAVPGTWELTGFVPDADVVWMPLFFGRSPDEVRKLVDGPIGDMVNAELEKTLDVKVIGSWFDLGLTNFATLKKQVVDATDLKGMKIRVSGGTGQFLHVKYYGASPDLTAWPDVPLALSQGMFDGLVASSESMASAKLWETGVRYVFVTNESMGEYIPMVTRRFWDKLPPDLQKLVLDVWAKNNPRYRQEMARRQDNARKELEERGVRFTDPSAAQLAEVRAGMATQGDEWARQIKISPAMLALLKQSQ